MIMEIWTNWDPLKEVIVGNCETTSNLNIHPESKKLFDKILKETKEDLDFLAKTLQKLDVTVWRPKPLSLQSIQLHDFKIKNPTFPIVPRDQYFVYGKSIYQTYTSMPDRFFDGMSYYEIFCDLYKRGFNWISQPPPLLKDFDDSTSWWSEPNYRYNNVLKDQILWHTATMFKCGDSLIVNQKGPGNFLGYDWIKRNIECEIFENKGTHCDSFGHIDHGFFMSNDDTVFSLSDWLPNVLENKNVIELDNIVQKIPYEVLVEIGQNYEKKGGRYSFDWLQSWLTEWRGYIQEVCFDTNVLVVDSHNIIFSNVQPKLFKIMENMNINCIVCPIRHGLFWESGIHCLTLDIVRHGNKRKIIH